MVEGYGGRGARALERRMGCRVELEMDWALFYSSGGLRMVGR
jgi:hypothetical protein